MDVQDRRAFVGQMLAGSNPSADLTLRLEETGISRSFRVHRSILSCRSAKFKGMLEGSFAESSQSVIDLDGLASSTNSLEKLIHYLYLDELELSGDTAVDLLGLASECSWRHRYLLLAFFSLSATDMLPHLFTLCEKYISENLSEDTACELLRVADMLSAPQLKRAILHFIKLKAHERPLSDLDAIEALSPAQRKELEDYLSA